MNQSLPSYSSSSFLFLTVSMVTSLILLINVSFKIILFQGLVFSASSLLCPLMAGLYLFALKNCTFAEQRHLLNISLMTLYLFCIGVYVLVNLPAAEYMHDNPVYQIIFEDIPKKFFATTIAFVLSFYLPHLLFCNKTHNVLSSPKQCVILALLGGWAFFALDLYLLFSGPHARSFKPIFIDSWMVSSLILLLIGVGFLIFLLHEKHHHPKEITLRQDAWAFPMYQYLVCFAVGVLLMCLACEYRIVSLTKGSMLAASCIFFPITMVISTLISELWGYKASVKLACVLIVAQFVFDALLMGLVAFPSPPFFNLNPFYNYILPRRLLAASLTVLLTFISNAILLHYLKHSEWKLLRVFRIIIANILASSLLCLVDYSVLFLGIYPYEQVMDLAVNVWLYKLLMTLISLPIILSLCKFMESNNLLNPVRL